MPEIRVEVVVVVGTEKSDWDTGDLNLTHLPPQQNLIQAGKCLFLSILRVFVYFWYYFVFKCLIDLTSEAIRD